MTLFLFIFFLVYGGVHLYAFSTAWRAFHFGTLPAVLLGFLLIVMVLAPVLVRMAERRGFEEAAKACAWTGYIWMGLLFLFVSAAAAIDLYHLLLFLAAKVTGHDLRSIRLSPLASFYIPLAWACLAGVYGGREARTISTEQVTIVTPKLPASAGKVTIVQVSDVHLGLIVREARTAGIIEAVRRANPDLLVSTGDFVDGQIDGLTSVAEMWRDLKPRYGKFAVTGNHEVYAGLEPSSVITGKAGFRILSGEAATVADAITIVGVDDPAISHTGKASGETEDTLLRRLGHDRFTLLLKHRPKVNEASIGLFDLQLSGHVHKGQIFPFNALTYLSYPVRTGLTRYPSGSSLYVSRGTGTWGPPIRFLAPPEVTIIELIPATPPVSPGKAAPSPRGNP